MDRIDLRSDTVTWPTERMRAALARASLGDDVYGEDPTVNALQRLAAELTGKEAALLVCSGTMGNLVSILTHTRRGDEAIVGEAHHTFCWEAGGMAVVGGVMPRPLSMDRLGRIAPAAIEQAVRDDDPHLPRSRLVLLENTSGGRFGAALPPTYLDEVGAIARRHGLAFHLDGARLFNAAVALGIPAHELTRAVDSVSFCLSKGLCAPVGSLVCGSAEFIHQARRARKLLGGGLRQAGVIAAAGIVALQEMVERLAEDHNHARQLAAGLADIPGVVIDLADVHTNLVFFALAPDAPLTAPQVAQRLRERYNIWVGAEGLRLFRAVTHYWIGSAEIDAFLSAMRTILTGSATG